jgi:hypothetical protein
MKTSALLILMGIYWCVCGFFEQKAEIVMIAEGVGVLLSAIALVLQELERRK